MPKNLPIETERFLIWHQISTHSQTFSTSQSDEELSCELGSPCC
nr:MAG TPA: hypothetical protein [Inoviridae sp.]